MMNLVRCASAALMLTPVAGAAQNYNAGLAAYVAGEYATALKEWRPLAEGGNAEAQFNLGIMYANGRSVPQNHAEAARWYRMAAEQGDVRAQYMLGTMYEEGQGVPQDYAEALRWYRLVAEQDDAWAQSDLGALYANGRGVPQDYVSAHMWFNLAVANGNLAAELLRDRVESLMTPADISEAQRRARVCFNSKYRDCD